MRTVYLFYCSIVLLLLAGCSNSKSEPFPNVQLELGLVTLDDKKDIDSLYLDDGRTYHIVEVKQNLIFTEDVIKPRVITYLESLDKGKGIIHSINQVPVIDPILEDMINPAFPRDPLSVSRVWISGGFLNIEYGMKAVDPYSHKILITEAPLADERLSGVIIKIWHDRNGDIEGSTKRCLVSIPLTRYLTDKQDFQIRFSIQTYEGLREFIFENIEQ